MRAKPSAAKCDFMTVVKMGRKFAKHISYHLGKFVRPKDENKTRRVLFFSVTLFLRRHLNCNPWKTNQQTSEDLSVANLVEEYFVGSTAEKKTVPLKTCVVLRKGQPNSRKLIKNELQSAEETGQIYAQRASHSDWLGCGPTMVKLYTSWPIVEFKLWLEYRSRSCWKKLERINK